MSAAHLVEIARMGSALHSSILARRSAEKTHRRHHSYDRSQTSRAAATVSASTVRAMPTAASATPIVEFLR
jgi:hypothetical protein